MIAKKGEEGGKKKDKGKGGRKKSKVSIKITVTR